MSHKQQYKFGNSTKIKKRESFLQNVILINFFLYIVSECQIHGRWSGFKPATKEVQEIADEVK